MPVACEHGAACHDGTESSAASAPEASRAWLLVEHPGPWPPEAIEAELPARLHTIVAAAGALGIRVQLIRRPGRRGRPAPDQRRTVLAGWTAGATPWLRQGTVLGASPAAAPPGPVLDLGLEALAVGEQPVFGVPVTDPVYLVCTHARRNACCGRFGLPLAEALDQRYHGQVWETTHVGGHRYAANLVLLPHGLYYGPVGTETATAAIEAYRDGLILPARYRGRAGQSRAGQQAETRRPNRIRPAGSGPRHVTPTPKSPSGSPPWAHRCHKPASASTRQ
jgi:hypothetical protein